MTLSENTVIGGVSLAEPIVVIAQFHDGGVGRVRILQARCLFGLGILLSRGGGRANVHQKVAELIHGVGEIRWSRRIQPGE
jgi:hypothetical protein